jgi:hypothetical protein
MCRPRLSTLRLVGLRPSRASTRPRPLGAGRSRPARATSLRRFTQWLVARSADRGSTRVPQFGQAPCLPSRPGVVMVSTRSAGFFWRVSTARRATVSDEYGQAIQTSVKCANCELRDGYVVAVSDARNRMTGRMGCLACCLSGKERPPVGAVRHDGLEIVSGSASPESHSSRARLGAPWGNGLRLPARDSIPMTRRGAPRPHRGRARTRSHPRLCHAA